MTVSVTDVTAEREVKSAIASAEEIIRTSPEDQPEVQPEVQPEALEQMNEEIPLANEECSSAALNDVTDEVTPLNPPNISGSFQNHSKF